MTASTLLVHGLKVSQRRILPSDLKLGINILHLSLAYMHFVRPAVKVHKKIKRRRKNAQTWSILNFVHAFSPGASLWAGQHPEISPFTMWCPALLATPEERCPLGIVTHRFPRHLRFDRSPSLPQKLPTLEVLQVGAQSSGNRDRPPTIPEPFLNSKCSLPFFSPEIFPSNTDQPIRPPTDPRVSVLEHPLLFQFQLKIPKLGQHVFQLLLAEPQGQEHRNINGSLWRPKFADRSTSIMLARLLELQTDLWNRRHKYWCPESENHCRDGWSFSSGWE